MLQDVLSINQFENETDLTRQGKSAIVLTIYNVSVVRLYNIHGGNP